MSVYIMSLNSFCATCLSQGRKMYEVKLYPPPYFMLVKNFILTGNDRLCWECHHFVIRMEAFRQKALRAQACLAAVLNGHPTQLQSLSTLVTSTDSDSIIDNPQDQIETENFTLTESVKLVNDTLNEAIEDDVAIEANDATCIETESVKLENEAIEDDVASEANDATCIETESVKLENGTLNVAIEDDVASEANDATCIETESVKLENGTLNEAIEDDVASEANDATCIETESVKLVNDTLNEAIEDDVASEANDATCIETESVKLVNDTLNEAIEDDVASEANDATCIETESVKLENDTLNEAIEDDVASEANDATCIETESVKLENDTLNEAIEDDVASEANDATCIETESVKLENDTLNEAIEDDVASEANDATCIETESVKLENDALNEAIEDDVASEANDATCIETESVKLENDALNEAIEDDVASEANDATCIETESVKLENDALNEAIEDDVASEANDAIEYKVASDTNEANVKHTNEMNDFQVFHHSSQPHSSESIANASLASLLNKKRSEPPLPVLPRVPSLVIDGTSQFKIRLPSESEKYKLQSEENPTQIDNIEIVPKIPFTEEILTEEEFAVWWGRKRQESFYLCGITVYRCEMCAEPFYFRPSFKSHEKMHTEMYGELSCDVCQIRCINEDALTAHKKKHYKLLKCGYCPFKWDNVNSMRQHCCEEHKVPIKLYTCEICLREEPSRVKLQRHLNIHTTAECPECGLKFKAHTLKSHMLTHNRGERAYSCECGRKFHRKSVLKKHMLLHSTEVNEKAYCIECDIQYQNIHAYNDHMKRSLKHATKERLSRFECKECGQKFPTAGRLRDHADTHSERNNYPCDICQASFKTRTRLRVHRVRQHEARVKPKKNICDYCGKGFSVKKVLVDHIYSHTGVRPYKCHLCGDAFSYQSARYLHLRGKHKIPKKKD